MISGINRQVGEEEEEEDEEEEDEEEEEGNVSWTRNLCNEE